MRWFVLPLVAVVSAVALAEEPKAVEPFNGKDLSGWKVKEPATKSNWVVGVASLPNPASDKLTVGAVEAKAAPHLVNAKGGGVDLYTEEKFGDATYELEFMIPKGSNSGIYLMGEYEVQVFDSFGKSQLGMGDLGAVYSAAVPRVNAAKRPGEWQKFVIEFQAPRFEAGKKVANARFVKVFLNNRLIHQNVEVKGPTPGGLTGKEAPTGPLMFQGDHGPVAYRNIKITPKGR